MLHTIRVERVNQSLKILKKRILLDLLFIRIKKLRQILGLNIFS